MNNLDTQIQSFLKDPVNHTVVVVLVFGLGLLALTFIGPVFVIVILGVIAWAVLHYLAHKI